MNQDFTKLWKLNLPAGIGCWLPILLIFLLFGSVGLKWVVNSVLILVAVLIITPVVAWLGVSWWLKRNLIEDKCPVCQHQFIGFNNRQCNCPNCGEPLQVEKGHFVRITPPGTIDVEAVDVSVQVIDES